MCIRDSGSYVQKKALELLGNEPLDAVFRVRLKNICSKGAKNEIVQIMLPATFEQLESARQFLGIDSLNMVKLVQVEALRPYLGEHLPLHGTDMRRSLIHISQTIHLWFLLLSLFQSGRQVWDGVFDRCPCGLQSFQLDIF